MLFSQTSTRDIVTSIDSTVGKSSALPFPFRVSSNNGMVQVAAVFPRAVARCNNATFGCPAKATFDLEPPQQRTNRLHPGRTYLLSR